MKKGIAGVLLVLAMALDASAQNVANGQVAWQAKCATAGCHGVGGTPSGARANAADAPALIAAIQASMGASPTATERIDIAAYIESVIDTTPASGSSTWPDPVTVNVVGKVSLNWTFSHLTTLETVSAPASGSVGYSGTVITFTPATAGNFSFTYRGTNAGGTIVTSNRTVNITVSKDSQTITFGGLSGKTYGNAPFTVSATASSGLTVAFTSSTTAVCTVSGTTVTIIAAGPCTINANQAGNVNFNAAPPVPQSFTVAPSNQTISFGGLAGKTYGNAPFTVSATASSGLPVVFTSATTGVCTVSGTTVTIIAAGPCTINANQAGNGNFNAATQVQQGFTVAPSNQTITFGGLAGKTYGNAPFTVSATASSGLTVAFTSATTGVCTVSGTTVTIVAAGPCTINANQAGNGNFNAATQVQQGFTVAPSNQTITFATLSDRTMGDAPFAVSATATSGLTVTFSSSTATVCTVSGTTVTLVSVGSCTINANQVGNGNFNAAPQVSRAFIVFTPAAVPFDFTGDDRTDLVWLTTSANGREVYLWPMNGTTILPGEGYAGRPVGDTNWQVETVGDFNGDGKADILWRNYATGEIYYWPMNGVSILGGEGFVRTLPANWVVLGVGDFNGDGRDDLLWYDLSTGQMYMWMMNGTSVVGEGPLRTVSDPNWQVVGIADFNGDGKADILLRNSSTGQVYLWPMLGTTILPGEGSVRTVSDLNWQVAGIGDLNGDGRADVLLRNAATGQNYLWTLNGTTVLPDEGFVRSVVGGEWQLVCVADLTADGRADLLWRNTTTGQNYFWPMSGTTVTAGEGFVRTVPVGAWTIMSR